MNANKLRAAQDRINTVCEWRDAEKAGDPPMVPSKERPPEKSFMFVYRMDRKEGVDKEARREIAKASADISREATSFLKEHGFGWEGSSRRKNKR